MESILSNIIKEVLKHSADTNLESEAGRQKIADKITKLYYTSSSDFISIFSLEENKGEEYVQPSK